MEGGYMRVSPCIILRSFEKPKATTGCVALVALPTRHLNVPRGFARARIVNGVIIILGRKRRNGLFIPENVKLI